MALETILCDGLSASIDSMGAQLMSLKVADAEYLWQGNPDFWPRRAPVLFPCVGCLKDDASESAQGPVHLKRHGIARLYDHEVVSNDGKKVVFELTSSEKTKEAFPFDFKLNMEYEVDGTSLTQTFRVTNTGDVELPFTLGGHPAFNVPVPGADDESFEDYKLVFAEPWCAKTPKIDEAGLHDFSRMTTLFEDAREMDLSHAQIEQLLTLVFCDVPNYRVSLVGKKSGHGVELEFPGFDYLGVWTASADAPFVAIEPWHGCADAYDESGKFEDKRDTIELAPGCETELAFTITPF